MKYRNKKIKVDGILFDSTKEADYYSELKVRMRIREIAGFAIQATFILQDEDKNVITYIADFIVFFPDGHAEVVETKGVETDSWKIKQKLFHVKYPAIKLVVVK